MVVATHDQDLVAEIADRVLVIADGTVVTESEPQAVAPLVRGEGVVSSMPGCSSPRSSAACSSCSRTSGIEPPGGSIPATVALATIVALGSIEIGARRLDAKGIALLACLAALAAAMRLALITGIAGFSPFFFLVLCAGYVFGPSYGFLTGTVAMLVSAIVSGGLGPWLPYQIFAAGWVGLGAGLRQRRPRPAADPARLRLACRVRPRSPASPLAP